MSAGEAYQTVTIDSRFGVAFASFEKKFPRVLLRVEIFANHILASAKVKFLFKEKNYKMIVEGKDLEVGDE